ncbi:MAG: carboxypeptidase regulatory-like domain-containing protein, partial [Rudanella sp.]|nr:carboxypeptidase regulatory-like domain-containing protein [Rudanella sp.]
MPITVLPASLGDYVWLDNNGNGVQDSGEPGVPNVTVTLYSNGSAVATTSTSTSVLYSFTGLTPGSYQVVFTAPVGTTFTTPLAGSSTATDSNVNSTTGQLGGTAIVSLTAGENNPTIDAGLIPLKASLGDYVWFDNNGDGQQGPMGMEPPVPGVLAQLYIVGNATPIGSATTNTSGFYSFTGLQPGQYYVVFTAPAGTTFTTGLQGNPATDSNVSSVTGQAGATGIVSLSAGENNPTIDAGLIPLKASLGNYVWLDSNSNGQQDATETGVANVTVTLFSNGSAIASQTTSGSGTYLFTNLDPGQYSVVFTAPGGFTFTTANLGNDATDSDAG